MTDKEFEAIEPRRTRSDENVYARYHTESELKERERRRMEAKEREMRRMETRRVLMDGRSNTPPVDVDELKRDAMSLDESVRVRMSILADWLDSQQMLVEELIKARMVNKDMYMQLHEIMDRIAVYTEKSSELDDKTIKVNELLKRYQEQYLSMQRKLVELSKENAEVKEELAQTKQELAQTKQDMADMEQQLAAKSVRERERVLKEQQAAAAEQVKKIQEEMAAKVQQASKDGRKQLIDVFIADLRDRCLEKNDHGRGFLFDDLIGSTFSCTDMQIAIRELKREFKMMQQAEAKGITVNGPLVNAPNMSSMTVDNKFQHGEDE